MKLNILALVFIFLVSCFAAKAQIKEIFSDVPTVSYCELVNNAEKYDQQFVRVKATYFRSFEGSIFFDNTCKENKVSWIDFVKAYKQNTSTALLNRFRKLIKRSDQEKPLEVELSIVGKFDGKIQISTLKTKFRTFTFSVGYGHNDAFDYQLTVLKIEEIKKSKN